jgi:hypothetical protein
MPTSGRIPLKQVWAMLDDCAPGYRAVAREHNFLVTFNDRSYPSLPRGEHGKRENPEIQKGHIRHLIRQLEVDPDCAKKHLPQLR